MIPGSFGRGRNAVALSLALAAAAAWPILAADDVGMAIEPLSRQIVGDGNPISVSVVLSSSRPELSGAIEAWIDDSTHVFRREFKVGKGKFRFFLYPQPVFFMRSSECRLFVRLVEHGGQTRDAIQLVFRGTSDEWSVLAVMGAKRYFGSQEFSPLRAAVSPVRETALLPDEWYGYRSFDAVFWDGTVRTPLDPAQKKALADWIRSGGTLILGAKAGDVTVHSPVPEAVPDLHISQEAGVDGGRFVPAANEITESGEDPFAVKRFGLGAVVFLQMDFNELNSRPESIKKRLLSGWDDRKLLKPPGGDFSGKAGYVRYSRFVEAASAGEIPWGTFQTMLAAKAGYVTLNFTPILVTMIVYILFVSVVDYLVLRKVKRLPWTWATFPALIVCFSIYSFFAFYKGRVGDLVRHEVLYEDVANDGSRRMKAWCCIRDNSNAPLRFEIPEAHFPLPMRQFSQANYFGYERNSGQANWFQSTAGKGIQQLTMEGYIGSFRFFELEWIEDAVSFPFTADLRGSSAGLEGQIVPGAGRPAYGAVYVFYQGRVYLADGSLRVQSAFDNAAGAEWRFGLAATARTQVSALDLRNKALVVALSEEKTTCGRIPVTRRRWIRQMVDVATGE